jgi:hypothetical protein
VNLEHCFPIPRDTMGLIHAPLSLVATPVRRIRRFFRRSSSSDDHETSLSYSSESDPSSPHFLTVTIEQPLKGFFCTLKAIGKVDLPPRQVFDILTSSENPTEVFKSIKRVNYRKPISDDGNRKQTEVEHVGVWRFGPLKGEFIVRMMVHQDQSRGKIKFKLIKSSLMKDFSGEWTIEPFDEDSLDEMVRYPNKKWGKMHAFKKAMHRFEESMLHTNTQSLVQLRQSVQPKFMPPPPFDRVLKQITLWQVKCIIRDLNEEAERVKMRKEGKAHRGGYRGIDLGWLDQRWKGLRGDGSLKGGRDVVEDVTGMEAFISELNDSK